jgi:hypothetical protein
VAAYNFEADSKIRRSIRQLIRALKGRSEKLYELSEDLSKVPNASALKDLAPG